jgi:hypothetical protein
MIVALLICGILASNFLYSQNQVNAITFSSVGVITNFSNNSMPFHFTSKNGCVDVQNGVAVLIGERSKGNFIVNCKTPVKLNSLGTVLYPNPVSTKTTIRFTKKPLYDEDFVLAVLSIEGNLLFSAKVSASELALGRVVNLSGINLGTYLITVESSHYKETIKFLRTN